MTSLFTTDLEAAATTATIYHRDWRYGTIDKIVTLGVVDPDADESIVLESLFEIGNIGDAATDPIASAYRGVKVVEGVQRPIGSQARWSVKAGVWLGCRSLSVDDLVQLRDVVHRVASCGYELASPSDVALVAALANR